MSTEKIKEMTIEDINYPPLLKKISKPPRSLCVRGNLDLGNRPTIAVVGTRRCSDYGKRAAIDLVSGLSKAGCVIVSGLAIGIDSIAHQTALDNNAKTIAVLGSGIDDNSIYPQGNVPLAKKIIDAKGAIVSEYAVGTKPELYYFPERNRIIAGLSQAILIIEAKEKSGALITAKYGLKENKPVFAIPGSIYSPNSAGCHYLIKNGAKLVVSANDILEVLDIDKVTLPSQNAYSPGEKTIIDIIGIEPTHIDQIIQKSKLGAAKVIPLLTNMEAEGKIRNIGGNLFVPVK